MFGDLRTYRFFEFNPYPNTNLDICALGQPARHILGTCSSSIRYKKDVEDFTPGLSIVQRLRPVAFTWKSNDERDLGFIAEEVNQVEPLLATKNETGEIQGVRYKQISVALVNAVNEQQDEIKIQKSAIETQKAQIETQQKTIERQQKQIDALVKFVCAGNSSVELCQQEQK